MCRCDAISWSPGKELAGVPTVPPTAGVGDPRVCVWVCECAHVCACVVYRPGITVREMVKCGLVFTEMLDSCPSVSWHGVMSPCSTSWLEHSVTHRYSVDMHILTHTHTHSHTLTLTHTLSHTRCTQVLTLCVTHTHILHDSNLSKVILFPQSHAHLAS